jgi:hypothetical protein
MQQLIDQITEAKRKGQIPPYELYAWCIFEDAAQVKNCRQEPSNEDLPEWEAGMDEDVKEECKCTCTLSMTSNRTHATCGKLRLSVKRAAKRI